MPVTNIIHALAQIEKQTYPAANIYEDMPTSLKLPAIIHWLPGGDIIWPRDITYNITHHIEVRLFFSLVNQPESDHDAKAWIEPMRKAIDKDPKLLKTCFNAGMTGYKYGQAVYSGNQYNMLVLNINAIEKIIAGEIKQP